TYYFSELSFYYSQRRNTMFSRDWSSDVCSSDLHARHLGDHLVRGGQRHYRSPDGLADPALRPGAPVRSVRAAVRHFVLALRILLDRQSVGLVSLVYLGGLLHTYNVHTVIGVGCY